MKFKVGTKLKKHDLSNTSADISSPGTTNNNTFYRTDPKLLIFNNIAIYFNVDIQSIQIP